MDPSERADPAAAGGLNAAALRALPSVDALAARLDAPHPVAVHAARSAIDTRRDELLAGDAGEADLEARARALLAAAARPSLTRVLNATGVVIHTNLGRAPQRPAARGRHRERVRPVEARGERVHGRQGAARVHQGSSGLRCRAV